MPPIGFERSRRSSIGARSRRHDPIALHIGSNAGRALTGVSRLRSRKGERWFYAASGCDFRPLGLQHLKNVARPVDVVECKPK